MPQPRARALAIHTFNDSPDIHLQTLPLRPLGAQDVQIKVSAVSINPVDLATAQGAIIGGVVYPGLSPQFPMVLGWDVAGTIEVVGAAVTDWHAGDNVIAMIHQPATGFGTMAEHIVVPAQLLAPWYAATPAPMAAALPLAGLTASQAVDSLRLSPNETVLINGPLGAVGRLAAQLARRAGATVVGIIRPAEAPLAQSLGIHHWIERGSDIRAGLEKAGLQIDAALDVVGGQTAAQTLASVRDNGRYATVIPHLAPGLPTPERGITQQVVLITPDAQRLAELSRMVADGELQLAIGKLYPFTKASDAFHDLATHTIRGKAVLMFDAPTR